MKRKRFYRCWLVLLCAALLSVAVWGAFPALVQAAGAAEVLDSEEVDSKETDSEIEERKIVELEEAGAEAPVEVTDVYTDSHGVTYRWHGYGDGTAEIYEFSFGEGDVVMEIPGSLGGYTVTKLTGAAGKREIVSVSIPESIEAFGQGTFRDCSIGTVYYNAADAVTLNSLYLSPFGYTEIGTLVVGDGVEKLEGYLFYETVFLQEELSLGVPWVAGNAFYRASFNRLDITDKVGKLEYGAFMDCEMGYLYFDSPDIEVGVSSTSGGPFYSTEILGLEFGGGMAEIPDYLFSYSEIRMKEIVFSQERIGRYAFANAWETSLLGGGEGMADRITLTGDVKTLGVRAFGRCCVDELVMEGNLEDEAAETMESPFYEAAVYRLSLGEGVDSLPDFLFSEACFRMPEMTVSTSRIGTACFQGVWDTKDNNSSPVELTITENVEYMGLSAFAYNKIGSLKYETNAVNGATATTNGVFQSSEIGELVIGEQVEGIQPFLFSNVKFVQDIDLVLDIPVGDYAFFSSQKSFNGFVHVKLGENVSYIGKGAFHYRDMDRLSYHAVSAAVELKSTNDAPFFGCVMRELEFGDQVEFLGKSLFCAVELAQDELVFPDSVREIGNYFFYDYPYLNGGIQVGTLRIGSGLKVLTDHTFHGVSFGNVYVEAWEAGEDYRALADGATAGYLPACENLYIHRKSDFYNYFAANAAEKHKKGSVTLSVMGNQQEEGFCSTLPLCYDRIPQKRTLTSSSLAVFVPFSVLELSDPGGINYSVNLISKNLVVYDRMSSANYNGFILGCPGMGKSMAAKLEMLLQFLKTDADIVVIDPENEYGPLAKLLGGQVIPITPGGESHINPMEIVADYELGDETSPVNAKADFILKLIECVNRSPFGINSVQETIIDECVHALYDRFMAGGRLKGIRKEEMPTLTDLQVELGKRREPEARELAMALKLYTGSGSLNAYGFRTNVEVGSRFVVYQIRDVGDRLKNLSMLTILDHIWNQIVRNRRIGRNTWFYVDEIYLLFQNEYSATFLNTLFRRARKYGGVPTGISQNVRPILESPTARDMLQNCNFIEILGQAAPDRESLREILNLSDTELEYITNSPKGQGILYTGTAKIPFSNEIPKDNLIYRVLTTNPREMHEFEVRDKREQSRRQKEAKRIDAGDCRKAGGMKVEDSDSL